MKRIKVLFVLKFETLIENLFQKKLILVATCEEY